MRKKAKTGGSKLLKGWERMDFSFLSVSTGKITKKVHGIEFTYRVPTSEEDDEFTSIQFRQLTEGKSLTDTIAGRGKKESNSEKVIPFSKLPLRRFETLCTGWEPALKLNGKDLEFSAENVQLIINDLPKLAQQVDSALWAKYSEFVEDEQGN